MRVVVLASQLQVGNNPDAPGVVTTLTGAAIALFLVVFLWNVVGYTITLAHEGAHAIVIVLLGGKVEWIRLKKNQEGGTLPSHPKGSLGPLDEFVSLAAGYIGPPLFGLAAAEALGHGYPRLVLWGTFGLLLVALPSARKSLRGVATILGLGFVVLVVVARGSTAFIAVMSTTWAWVLLAGGLIQVLEDWWGGSDFARLVAEWMAAVWGLVYIAATLVVMFYAGLVMVGAREPFLG